MVQQQRRSEKTEEQCRKLDELKAGFLAKASVDCVHPNGRRGILKPTDEFGKKFMPYDHQYVSLHRLLSRDLTNEDGTLKPFAERKVALICVHEMGLGKTLTAICMIAGLHITIPNTDDEKTLIVVPKSVLLMWYREVTIKRTSYSDSQTVLLADHQTKLTMAKILAAKVIIVSPSVLTEAYKTYMFLNKKVPYETVNGKTKHRSEFQPGVDPSKTTKRALQFKDRLPPKHDIFQYLDDCRAVGKPAFSLAIVDEVHTCSKPTTWAGHVTKILCTETVYTVGLTGTPVSSRPRQLAWIVGALDARPEWLGQSKYYSVRGGGEACIRKSTITAVHEEVIDRVDGAVVDLVDVTHVTIEYDPFVGLKRDGSFDKEQIERNNSYLLRAQRAAMEATAGSGFRKGQDDYMWSAITVMSQMTFDATLGSFSAEAFRKEPTTYHRLSRRQPSETVRLIWRMLRDRQMAGKRRIVVYSVSTVMLEIARNYVLRTGGCGRLFLFKGSMDANEREKTINDFLCEANPQGVLFMSSAGSIGTTLCPGCETLFVVGDVPWNHSDLQQAYGRIHRISQDKPVEIVTFVPRRSITAAKLKAHEDKRDRLEPAMRDEDFSNFTAAEESQWKLRAQITMSLSTLDATGNYQHTAEQLKGQAVWQSACLAADAAGVPRPDYPAECTLPTPLRADDVVLPPVSYPVEGFEEPSGGASSSGSKRVVDSDSDSDSDLDELLTYSRSCAAGKRRMIDHDASADKLTTEARMELLRELVGGNEDSSSDEEETDDDETDDDETDYEEDSE